MLKSAILAALAAAASLAAANAEAGVSWSIGINVPPVAAVVGAPVYRAPPVAYGPVPAYAAPVYAEPVYAEPVYVRHRPARFVPVPVYGPGWRAVPRAVVYPYRRERWAAVHPGYAVPYGRVVAPVYGPVPARPW